MQKKDLPKTLPDTPGVYFFTKKRAKKPLYIGKATSLRDRVRSYFNSDLHATRGPRLEKAIHDAEVIEIIKTDSVLEAFLLETELIKKFKPKYNEREKDDKSFNYVVVTKEAYPEIRVVRGKELMGHDVGQYKKIFGPYPQSQELKEALRIVRRIFPWRDARCEPGQGKPCFNRQIGLCPGCCTGEIGKREYQMLVRNLVRFMSGKKKEVIRDFKKRMHEHTKKEEFEKAKELRDKIFTLDHIQDVALLKREYTKGKTKRERIEAYDIAHTGGANAVGAMVVSQNGVLSKSEYRKFKIRSEKGIDDTGNLKEVLKRRLAHNEWQYPDAILVDGGQAQVNAARAILSDHSLSFPVIGVVKDKTHKPQRFIGPKKFIDEHKEIILLLNMEAHRFAISFHKERRSKSFRNV